MWNPRVLLFRSLCLTSICTLAACGAGSDLPKAQMGAGGGYQKQSELELKRIPRNAVSLDGQLSLPSDQDVAELSVPAKLPMLLPEDSDRNYITFSDSDENRGSNLIFRAIQQIPPKDAIRKVKKFELRLSGVNLFIPSSFLSTEITQGQILCFLDGGACVGSRGGLHLSSIFQEPARQLEGDWLSASDFTRDGKSTETALEDRNKLLSAPGEVVVDFLKHLKGEATQGGRATVDFIYAHSEEYSEAENGFRKFRFAMSGRVHASSGKLVLEFETDPAQLPSQFNARPAIPKKGASDQVFTRDQVKAAGSGGLEETPVAELSSGEANPERSGGDASST
jgi:hypothetical protein